MTRFHKLAAAATAIAVFASPGASLAAAPRSVVDIARSFDDGGGYVWDNGTGTPSTIEHDGQVVLQAQEKGTYCSGFTFAVAMQAAAERGLLRGKALDDVRRFQKAWYGAVDDAAERQCAAAVEQLGVGVEVKSLDDARPGDFVQLWRTNKSGHSVVLLAVLREGDRVVGLRYRSSQKSTNGIGDRSEY
ncbi:MAG: hypothetical protein DCC67_08685, partial [Planctomycetota bacterium]